MAGEWHLLARGETGCKHYVLKLSAGWSCPHHDAWKCKGWERLQPLLLYRDSGSGELRPRGRLKMAAICQENGTCWLEVRQAASIMS